MLQADLGPAQEHWLVGMVASGAAPFDTLDASSDDNNIRTHDNASYRVAYTTVGVQDTNAYVQVETGSFTLPANYTGPAVDSIGYFDPLDIPTACQNIQTAPIDVNNPNGESGVSADGQILLCAQPAAATGMVAEIKMRIAGHAPNGATVSPPSFSFFSDQTPVNNSPNVLEGISGEQEYYGLPTLTVKAEPRWDIKLYRYRNAEFIPASGPAGEDGFVFSMGIATLAKGSRLGLEALSSPVRVDLNFQDNDFPNAQIVHWDLQLDGLIAANFSDTGNNHHDGCGNWYNQLPVVGNFFDNRHYIPGDRGDTPSTSVDTVANGGDCRLHAFDNSQKTAELHTTGTDFGLFHWPSKSGRSAAADILVNPSNMHAASNQWWVSHKSVLIWAPESDVPQNTTRAMSISATLASNSVSGQENHAEDMSDNTEISRARRRLKVALINRHTPPVWSNPNGLDYTVRDPTWPSDSHVNQVSPNQVLASRLGVYNTGTSSLPAGYVCERLDNTRLSMIDIRSDAYTHNSKHIKDPDTGILARKLSGLDMTFNWQLGIGGNGVQADTTWDSYNATASEYDHPAQTSSSQSDTFCDDDDATWYNSIEEVLAAEGPDGLQKVSRVRGQYDSYLPGTKYLIYIPQQANGEFAFSSVDNGALPPAPAPVAGEATSDSMAIQQTLWQTNEPLLYGTGIAKASDAVKMLATEYVRVDVQSTSHGIEGGTVQLQDIVDYALTVNLSTTGQAHKSDVAIWSVLPNYVRYLPNTTQFAGLTLPDPVCASNGLPQEIFPGNDNMAAGEVAAGYSACVWTLEEQQVTKAVSGSTTANLPPLRFIARVEANTPINVSLLHSVTATSTANLFPNAIYSDANTGFTCRTREVCQYANWLLRSDSTPRIGATKWGPSVIRPESEIDYSLIYSAAGQDFSAIRLIDILPHQDDHRVPQTDYHGTMRLVEPIAAPVADPLFGSSTDANFLALYTNQLPIHINPDPYHASHTVDGTGTNNATETNWCTEAQFNSNSCPSSIDEVKGVLLLPDGLNGAGAVTPANTNYLVHMTTTTTANPVGDTYNNQFTIDSPTMVARRLSSNSVHTLVSAPDLTVAQSVQPNTVQAGESVNFELLVSNYIGGITGPIYADDNANIRIVNTLESGMSLELLSITAVGWDCSASTMTTLDCSYTGSYPIGIGATLGSAIRFDALVDSGVVDNSVLTSTANVELTGLVETDYTNNGASSSITAHRSPDLSISQSLNAATVTQLGAMQLSLTAEVEQDGGPAKLGPINLRSELPTGVNIANNPLISGVNWDCGASVAPRDINCLYTGSYPVARGEQLGGELTIQLQADIDAPVGDLAITSRVVTIYDENSTNNSADSSITILAALADISGKVFTDTNTNGSVEPGEIGIASVNLTLCAAEESPCSTSNTIQSTSSDSAGAYVFSDLTQGTYYVVQAQPAGFGSSTNNIATAVRTGQTATENVDFGETLGTISGYVYADVDHDGARAATGEAGLGVATSIFLSGTTLDPSTGADTAVARSVAADPLSGLYTFTDVHAPKPGTGYTLSQQPATVEGFINGTTTVGTLNASTPTLSDAGTANSANSVISNIRFSPPSDAVEAPTINAVHYNFGENPHASISGSVYVDSNNDGSLDVSDQRLGDVEIILCNSVTIPCPVADVYGSTTTAPNGSYLFNAVPTGSYTVQQTQPLSYASSSNNSVAVVRVNDSDVSGINFSERGAIISGKVFVDADKSQSRSAGDTDYTQASARITVSGTSADNIAVEEQLTVNSTGIYSFKHLPTPNADGYQLSLDPESVSAPFYAHAAYGGTTQYSNGSDASHGNASELSITNIFWQNTDEISSEYLATGINYDFSVIPGVGISGRVMRDVNASNTGNFTLDPTDKPTEGVVLQLCTTKQNPCATDNTLATTQSDADGEYQFDNITPGEYWVVQQQPIAFGNGPGALDIEPVVVEFEPIADIHFLDRSAHLQGRVYLDANVNGRDDNELGIAEASLELHGTDINGDAFHQTTTSDSGGYFAFNDVPAADTNGYTLVDTGEVAKTEDGNPTLGTISNALGELIGTVGTVINNNTIGAIHLPAGASANDYEFAKVPATASVSGTVWRDRNSDRQYNSAEGGAAGWTVQLLKIPTADDGLQADAKPFSPAYSLAYDSEEVVAEQITGADGSYNFENHTAGDYRIVFRAPATTDNGHPSVWGNPVNGEQGLPAAHSNAEIGDGIIRRITLRANRSIDQQSLPLDPSGVVYDADKRVPIPGAVVTLVGPSGFDPAAHLLGGAEAASQTTSTTGEYQFRLLDSAPIGEYQFSVDGPAGYDSHSALLPPEAETLTPPNGASTVFRVVPSTYAPAVGEQTSYYTSMHLTPGVNARVVNNHIPLDPLNTSVLFMTKQADSTAVAIGDSLKYTISMHNRGASNAPALSIEDELPLGFKLVHGTVKLRSFTTNADLAAADDSLNRRSITARLANHRTAKLALDADGESISMPDPSGSPGPLLIHNIPSYLAPGETLELSYRARAGVGAERGGGTSKVTGVTGALRSEAGVSSVRVESGVFSDTACIVGRIFSDCNADRTMNDGEYAIPSVRVIMQDGRTFDTDMHGKYSVCGLDAGSQVLKVDPSSLPAGSSLVTGSRANLGDPGSILLSLTPGHIHRADFFEGSCSSLVTQQSVDRQLLLSGKTSHGEGYTAEAEPVKKTKTEKGRTLSSSATSSIQITPHQTSSEDGEYQPVRVDITLHGKDGKLIPGQHKITLTSDNAKIWVPEFDGVRTDAQLKDVDPNLEGFQTWVKNGQLRFLLLPKHGKTQATVTASVDAISAEATVDINPMQEQWVAAGLLEGVVYLNEGAILNNSSASLFDKELQEWQRRFSQNQTGALRAAFVFKGTIKGKYLLTATFDSEKDSQSSNHNIDPETSYPVFGDDSTESSVGSSNHKLFVRISKDKHYLLYGNFNTHGAEELGAYQRSLTGLYSHWETTNGSVEAYASYDTLDQQVEEFRANGTSGPYGINAPAIPGSLRVEIVERDRNLPTKIVQRRALQIITDFSFDESTGRILLKEPLPSSADNGNDNSLRVSYEQRNGGKKTWRRGVRAKTRIGDNIELGVSHHRDSSEPTNGDKLSRLSAVHASVQINEHLEVRGEYAHTTNTLFNDGSTISGAATQLTATASSASGTWATVLHAAHTDSDFRNENASYAEGDGTYSLKLRWSVDEQLQLNGVAQRNFNIGSNAQTDLLSLNAEYAPRETLRLRAGLSSQRNNGQGLLSAVGQSASGSVYNGSGLQQAGAGLFSGAYNSYTTHNGAASKSTNISLGADWDASEKLTLGISANSSIHGDSNTQYRLHAQWALDEQLAITARYAATTGTNSSAVSRSDTSTLALGLTRTPNDSARQFAELRMNDHGTNTAAALAYGVRDGFAFTPQLHGTASVEQVAILSGSGRTATAASTRLRYTVEDAWVSTASMEARRLHREESSSENNESNSLMGEISIAHKLGIDWSALAKFSLLGSDDKSVQGNQSQLKLELGAAYRSSLGDPISILKKITHKRERNDELAQAETREVWIGSLAGNWKPTRHWEMSARFATKFVDEFLDGVHDDYTAALLGFRTSYDYSEKGSFSLLNSMHYSPDSGTKTWALGLQSARTLHSNIELWLGYNWGGFDDAELAASEFTQQGWQLGMRYKFDEKLFKNLAQALER